MEYYISIDTGSTFTDGCVTAGDRIEWAKVDTTPHDLTVCLMDCMDEVAKKLDLSTEGMLRQTAAIRFSTTISTNTLLQKNGPKLGILVTEGFADTLYSESGRPEEILSFIWPGMIAGVKEGVDSLGKVVQPLSEEGVKGIVNTLLDSGARGLAVSFQNSPLNPIHEQQLSDIIEKECPRHYLGAIPVSLSTRVGISLDDHARTNTVILNAYLHRDMVRYLYRAEDKLRSRGYQKPLFVVHGNGGAARVAKTIALQTYNSGPVAGYMLCANMARQLYKVKDFVSVDVGGTTVDIGVGGEVVPDREPMIHGVRVGLPMISLGTVGGGGGSKVQVDPKSGLLHVGPESAGALPGPAAYDLGGMDPTVCDAELVLGYLNPDYYMAGTRKLNKERAIAAFKDCICSKTGLSLEEAAWKVIKQTEKDVALQIGKEIENHGLCSEKTTMFAFGGGGGGHCCGYASNLGIRNIIVFRFNAVASAFGVSTMDVLHIYQRGTQMNLGQAEEIERFNSVVAELVTSAKRDMKGEGFDPSTTLLDLELRLQGETGSMVLDSPYLYLERAEQAGQITELYNSRAQAGNCRAAEVIVQEITLKALCPMPHYSFPDAEYRSTDPRKALKEVRDIYWVNRCLPAEVYERDDLQCGNQIEGPAIIEAPDTTYLIPPGWTYTVDKYLNGKLKEN